MLYKLKVRDSKAQVEVRSYFLDDDKLCVAEPLNQSFSIKKVLFDIFLPNDFPASVTTNQASLAAIGVGDSTSTTTAAMLTWIFKEGSGMVGKLIFAYKVSDILDKEAKKFRLLADIFNDLSRNTFSSLCGVSAGGTKAALSLHFARCNNLGDLSAKDDTQNLNEIFCLFSSQNYFITFGLNRNCLHLKKIQIVFNSHHTVKDITRSIYQSILIKNLVLTNDYSQMKDLEILESTLKKTFSPEFAQFFDLLMAENSKPNTKYGLSNSFEKWNLDIAIFKSFLGCDKWVVDGWNATKTE
ncbi:hypothetical protein HK099_006793 [Clydaea vesicula]|uniref:Protein root UVB sensitive/RUS domain-containing protein n=1 Tax=Clydaea vesicula TaxID=447962 RepID=A0AAD5TXV4_9FUNG|nr:hypothetical protein HK099_006793 [Clydaea vesicula]